MAPKSSYPPVAVGDRFRIVLGDERPPFEVVKVIDQRVVATGLPDPFDLGTGSFLPGEHEERTMSFPRLKVQQALAITAINGWVL
jgi:hypothetical protein